MMTFRSTLTEFDCEDNSNGRMNENCERTGTDRQTVYPPLWGNGTNGESLPK